MPCRKASNTTEEAGWEIEESRRGRGGLQAMLRRAGGEAKGQGQQRIEEISAVNNRHRSQREAEMQVVERGMREPAGEVQVWLEGRAQEGRVVRCRVAEEARLEVVRSREYHQEQDMLVNLMQARHREQHALRAVSAPRAWTRRRRGRGAC